MQPLILTLKLDETSQSYFNYLRQQHFPPERNYLQAHLTLFHHLPGQEQTAIKDHLLKVVQQYEALPLQVDEVKMIGRGVAYKLQNDTLLRMHQQLASHWQTWLTSQDRQKLWPHITVQNKVSPAKARALHLKLSDGFTPFTATGTGLSLWAYLGGPWEWIDDFSFGI